MDITSLGLHVTDRCNARCLHCAFCSGPEIEGSMGLEEARQYVTDAKALDTGIVCITGGEPMLHPTLVEKIVSECSRLSFPEIWLFTNCFWAHNVSKAHAIVEKLRSLGLKKMFFSVDFFHQRYVPIESVKNAIEASVGSSLEVCIDARFVGEPDEENEFNSATCSHLEFLGNLLSEVEVTKAQPMFVGRAAESLAKHVRKKPLSQILNEVCPGVWAGGTLESPLGVDVDEFGFVTICPGLSIGNAQQASLRETIETYDYRDYAIIAALHDDGMEGLMRLASRNGFVPRETYVNGCHFCYEARKFLKNYFPEALALPATVCARASQAKQKNPLNDKFTEPNEMTEMDWKDEAWDMIYKQRKIKEAINYLNEVIKEKPQNDQAFAIKANALNQLASDTKNWDHTVKALRCAEKALQINPHNETALFNKAWSLVNLSRPTEALEYADKALEINPNNVYAWYNKAWAHHLLHQIEEALTCCNKMIEINLEFTEWAEKMKNRIKNREFPEHLSKFSKLE